MSFRSVFRPSRRSLLAAAATMPAVRAWAAGAAVPPRFVVADDGSFDVESGPVALRGCFPAFDEAAIHPRAVTVTRRAGGATIRYALGAGSLVLELASSPQSLSVAATLEGTSVAPHHVFPLASGKIEGANRFYRQGLGFGGPSGLHPLPAAEGWNASAANANTLRESAWSYDSYLTTALVAATGQTLAIGALAHGDYLQRTTLYDRTRRFQLVDKRALVDSAFIEAGFATERIPLAGRPLSLPALHLVSGGGPYATLQALARMIAHASHARTDKPPRFHWDTWYEYLHDYDLARLEDAIEGIKRTGVPVQGIVVDAGYCPLGDWTIAKPPRWPGGLEAAFAKIKAAGLEPGAYVAPFMVSSHSELYRKHPEAVIHGLDGKPLVHGKGKPIIDTLNATEERYFLDTSHPAGFAHVRDVFRTLHGWGARFFKTDFWEWGFKDSTEIRRHTPGKTSVQHLVDVVKLARAEIGEDSYFMGCIAPLAPFIGYVDSMRVGYDTDPATWRPEGSLVNMFNETNAGQYFHDVFWANDPDVVFLRGTTNPLSDDEASAIAYWVALLGGLVVTSDRLHRLWPHRLNLLRFIQPGARKLPADLPFWADGRKDLVAVRRYADRDAWAVLVVNPTEAPIDVRCPLSRAIGQPSAFAFAWSPGHSERLGRKASLDGVLPPHHARLYYLAQADRAPPASMSLAGELVPGLRA